MYVDECLRVRNVLYQRPVSIVAAGVRGVIQVMRELLHEIARTNDETFRYSHVY